MQREGWDAQGNHTRVGPYKDFALDIQVLPSTCHVFGESISPCVLQEYASHACFAFTSHGPPLLCIRRPFVFKYRAFHSFNQIQAPPPPPMVTRSSSRPPPSPPIPLFSVSINRILALPQVLGSQTQTPPQPLNPNYCSPAAAAACCCLLAFLPRPHTINCSRWGGVTIGNGKRVCAPLTANKVSVTF